MTPAGALTFLRCPLCMGKLSPRNRPWTFGCKSCRFDWRPTDYGPMRAALEARAQADAPAPHRDPREKPDSFYLPGRIG